MNKIVLLNEELSNLIAAGEVVENMASVVKELVENSIDAGATRIDVSLLEEGLKEIQITDDGSGMNENDMKLSIKRHATSKIKTSHDLFHIQSLGFRGEALPSIASVSKLEMISGDGENAHKMIVKNGQLTAFDKHAPLKGTRVTIKDLFYNTPARLKHLKATSTELSYISDYMNKMALSHPEISFTLSNNHKLLFATNGDNDILKILANIYSIEISKEMRYFENENGYFKIKGYLTKPFIHRSTRKHMSVIANNRMIKNTSILKAIVNGYHTYLPIGKYPIVALFIEMDPLLIDVNVHPQKLEVKLTEEQLLRRLITNTIQDKLRTLDLIPDIKQKPKNTISQPSFDLRENTTESTVDYEFKEQVKRFVEESVNQITAPTIKEEKPSLDERPSIPKLLEEKTKLSRLDYIGQYLGTYLICQNDTGLFLIDQHAAAERIRYENYYEAMGNADANQTKLLVPLKLNVSNDEIIALEDYKDTFKELGVEFIIQNDGLCVSSVPYWFIKGYETIYTEEMIKKVLEDGSTSVAQMRDSLAKNLSCKHSIKANHYLNANEIDVLLRDLENCKNPYTCPHGRPVIIRFTQSEIEKMFYRIQS